MEYKESNTYRLTRAKRASPPTHSYRLHKICEIQKYIEQERDNRAALSKKYHRIVRIIDVVDNTLVAATMGLGVVGVGLLSTIIAAPIVIAMEATALGTGVLGIIGKRVSKKLALKAEKHEKIKTLADAKLNTISDYISKSLKDDHISDEEYSLILSEFEKFNIMKEEIRSKIKVGIGEETKPSLISQGREDVEREGHLEREGHFVPSDLLNQIISGHVR
jgi:hypothetical protein